MTAYTGAPMILGGWYSPVVVDLSGLKVPRQTLPILREHDASRIVAHTDGVEVTASGVKVAGIMSGVGEAADEVRDLAANGFPWQASIGASVQRREFVEPGHVVNVNGRPVTGPIIVAREATLREISFVPIGADTATSAAVAAQQRQGTQAMTFEQWLQGKGIDIATLNDATRAALSAAWKAETAPAVTPPPPAPTPPAPQVTPAAVQAAGAPNTVEQVLAAAQQERDRRERIAAIVAEAVQQDPYFAETAGALAAAAIEGRWDTQRFELEVLRARRPGAPALIVASGREERLDARVIEAAICQAGGLTNLEKHFDEKTLEASHRRFRHGLGLQEVILFAAQANGCRERNVRSNLPAVLRAAFAQPTEIRAAGVSTYDISGILSNTANKFLREGFMAVERAWSEFAARRPVNDFKAITTYSLTGDNTYEQVAPGGELKHGSLGELTYTNQADTYGKILGIDRRDIINDDLGALTGVSRRLGRGGALKLNDVFWTAWLDDSTFFPTDGSYNNYHADGTTSLLTIAGLTKAQLMFRRQQDADSKPLAIRPRILLVPPEHEVAAANLMNSTLTAAAESTVTKGLANVFQGLYRIVSSTYLSNSAFTGYSITAWYLLADPQDLPAIEVCFLNGQEMPTVETADMDFDRLGISLRGFHDFGVTKQEYRAGVKMKGAA